MAREAKASRHAVAGIAILGQSAALLLSGCDRGQAKPSAEASTPVSATPSAAVIQPREPERSAEVSWSVSRGPAESEGEPDPSPPPIAKLTMSARESGEYRITLSEPLLVGNASRDGDDLRVSLHGDGDGTLILHPDGELYRGSLRASPAHGKFTLKADVVLTKGEERR
jgi:hypothetical protein